MDDEKRNERSGEKSDGIPANTSVGVVMKNEKRLGQRMESGGSFFKKSMIRQRILINCDHLINNCFVRAFLCS